MMLLYTIIITAVFFYIRFFIFNSLTTAAARKATFFAALKAIWFIPLFLQGLFLLAFGVIQFYNICKGFLLLLNYWGYNSSNNDVYDFLYLISYVTSTSLVLSLHFITGLASLNKKTDTLNLLYKAVYVTASYFIIQAMVLNAGLLHPIVTPVIDIVVYSHHHVITATCLLFMAAVVISIFYKKQHGVFRYVQLGILMSTAYIVICLLTGVLLFLMYTLLKVIT